MAGSSNVNLAPFTSGPWGACSTTLSPLAMASRKKQRTISRHSTHFLRKTWSLMTWWLALYRVFSGILYDFLWLQSPVVLFSSWKATLTLHLQRVYSPKAESQQHKKIGRNYYSSSISAKGSSEHLGMSPKREAWNLRPKMTNIRDSHLDPPPRSQQFLQLAQLTLSRLRNV